VGRVRIYREFSTFRFFLLSGFIFAHPPLTLAVGSSL